MKNIRIDMQLLVLIILYFNMQNELHTSTDTIIPVSQPTTAENIESFQGLLNMVQSYPSLIVQNNQIFQLPVNRLSRYMSPLGVMKLAQSSNFSILRPHDQSLYQNYPNGAVLFPQQSNIAQQFNAMIADIKSNQELIKFFRKMHLNILNQLYIHLMKVYTNLIVRHAGTDRDSQGNVVVKDKDFFKDEQVFATNQKILILMHFINVIESQFHGMILSCMPTLPYIFTTPIGKFLVQNDFSIDLNYFALPAQDEVSEAIQKNYINFLKKYINFFSSYTALLSTIDKTTGLNQFVIIAQKMNEGKLTTTMKPSMFFYNDQTIRALYMIPYIASLLPKKTELINWPEDIIALATQGIARNKHAVAYLKDDKNNIVTSVGQAQHLLLYSQSGDNIFEEELLKEPNWLSSSDGIMQMLQACLGDFSQLLKFNILDPFTQAIIERAVQGSVSSVTLQTVQDLSQSIHTNENS